MSHQMTIQYHDDDFSKRDLKEERKRRQAKDRSKYKKTDSVKLEIRKIENDQEIQKILENGQEEEIKRGVVILIQSHELSLLIDGKKEIGTVRGSIKRSSMGDKNSIVVGDIVLARMNRDGSYIIEAILPRKTVLCRQDNLNRIKRHLIAANIDQVFITVSIVNPHLRPSIIDRYLISAKKGGITPILLINKMDLLEQADLEEQKLFEEVLHVYTSLGIPVLPVSSSDPTSLQPVVEMMKDRISIFSGQSGTGKSSLINALLQTNLKTAETVERTKKGSHTTTYTAMLPLLEGEGGCIDSPGIKSFGIWDLTSTDIRDGFPEFQLLSLEPCQFTDCWHRGEKGCQVEKEAQQESQNSSISSMRYLSYCSLLSEITEERRRR